MPSKATMWAPWLYCYRNHFCFHSGTCSIIGDPHITTYDGKSYTMHLKQCAYVLSEHCHLPNGTDRGFSITIRNRYCSSLYSHCRRELLVNVTGEPFLILDVDDDSKKPTASIETEHGSTTSVTRDYSTEKMDVEFLGDRNIFIHVDLQVSYFSFFTSAK